MFDYNDNPEGLNVKNLVQQYEKMLAIGANIFLDSESFLDLIDFYEEVYELKKALEAAEYALINYPFSAIFHIRKAQLLLEEDRLEDANEALLVAKLYEPTNVDVFLTEAEILHQSQNYNAALTMLDNALNYADSNDIEDIYLLQAAIYESLEDYSASMKCLVNVLQENPSNEMAYSRIWMCMELTESYEEGVNISLKIIDTSPYSYWAWYNLGHAYMQLGLYEKACDAYDYAIVINEDFEFAYRDIIFCLFRLEDYLTAQRYITEYKELFDIDAEILLWEGEAYEYLGQYGKARSIYQDALKIDSLDGRIHYRMGVSFANEEKWKQAQKTFEVAYSQNKDNEEFCIALAEVYNQLDQIELAYNFFKKAIQIAPEESITWVSYLEFLIDEEDYETATEILNDAKKYCNDHIFDFSEAAILYLSGYRKEADIILIQLLEHGHDASKLFEIAPELNIDSSIKNLILSFLNKN